MHRKGKLCSPQCRGTTTRVAVWAFCGRFGIFWLGRKALDIVRERKVLPVIQTRHLWMPRSFCMTRTTPLPTRMRLMVLSRPLIHNRLSPRVWNGIERSACRVVLCYVGVLNVLRQIFLLIHILNQYIGLEASPHICRVAIIFDVNVSHRTSG